MLQCETVSILKKCANKFCLDVGFRPLLQHSVVGPHDVAWCFRRPQGVRFPEPNPVFGARLEIFRGGIPIPKESVRL